MLTLFGKGYQTKKIYGRKNQYFIIMLMHTKTKKTRENSFELNCGMGIPYIHVYI